MGGLLLIQRRKLQDELFAGERNSRGKSGTSRLAKHRCTHFPQVSFPLFSTTVLLSAFFAARGNRNNYCSHKFKHCDPCLFAFRIKWFPIGCRMSFIVLADWLIPFSATYASYLYELRKKVWWIALTNFLTNFVTFCPYEISYEKFGEYGPRELVEDYKQLVLKCRRLHKSFSLHSWQCSVNCGNGTQTRVVFCAGLVGGMYQEFPDEVCPRSASQSRSVICMNSNGQHSDSCESRERPVHWRKCNSPACPVAHRQPHNCEDNYGKSICHYVVQANFCRYPHYGKMCCGSCLKRRLRKH